MLLDDEDSAPVKLVFADELRVWANVVLVFNIYNL